MCIIVDANAAHDLAEPTQDGEPVLRWLLSGRGGLIIGGKLTRELDIAGARLRATLVVLNRAGLIRTLDDTIVEEAEAKIKAGRKCCSNDLHILAVATVSGCRLIFTKDKNLHKDAKNREVLRPAASIYKSKAHKRLLTYCRCP